MKVLLTDDSAFMRTILKASLKDVAGIEFMEAENGDVAVELYRNYRFDVVFLDIIMPVKNGIMAMEEIRQINPAAKIIFVTSVSQDEMVTKAQQLQANAFLAKPFQPEQIKQTFLQVLGQNEPLPPVASVVEEAIPVAPEDIPVVAAPATASNGMVIPSTLMQSVVLPAAPVPPPAPVVPASAPMGSAVPAPAPIEVVPTAPVTADVAPAVPVAAAMPVMAEATPVVEALVAVVAPAAAVPTPIVAEAPIAPAAPVAPLDVPVTPVTPPVQ